MRKRAGLRQVRLADALDQAARVGAADNYRVVDGTLVSRWERARQRNLAAAQFDARTLGDIVTLCRIVDGSTLALELAANWVGRICTAEMVRMLQRHNLSQLATDQRDLPARTRGRTTLNSQ